jgi:hypothetical protein
MTSRLNCWQFSWNISYFMKNSWRIHEKLNEKCHKKYFSWKSTFLLHTYIVSIDFDAENRIECIREKEREGGWERERDRDRSSSAERRPRAWMNIPICPRICHRHVPCCRSSLSLNSVVKLKTTDNYEPDRVAFSDHFLMKCTVRVLRFNITHFCAIVIPSIIAT